MWTNKHKELGRFAAAIFRLVEIVIDSVIVSTYRLDYVSRRIWLDMLCGIWLSTRKKHRQWLSPYTKRFTTISCWTRPVTQYAHRRSSPCKDLHRKGTSIYKLCTIYSWIVLKLSQNSWPLPIFSLSYSSSSSNTSGIASCWWRSRRSLERLLLAVVRRFIMDSPEGISLTSWSNWYVQKPPTLSLVMATLASSKISYYSSMTISKLVSHLHYTWRKIIKKTKWPILCKIISIVT